MKKQFTPVQFPNSFIITDLWHLSCALLPGIFIEVTSWRCWNLKTLWEGATRTIANLHHKNSEFSHTHIKNTHRVSHQIVISSSQCRQRIPGTIAHALARMAARLQPLLSQRSNLNRVSKRRPGTEHRSTPTQTPFLQCHSQAISRLRQA